MLNKEMKMSYVQGNQEMFLITAFLNHHLTKHENSTKHLIKLMISFFYRCLYVCYLKKGNVKTSKNLKKGSGFLTCYIFSASKNWQIRNLFLTFSKGFNGQFVISNQADQVVRNKTIFQNKKSYDNPI